MQILFTLDYRKFHASTKNIPSAIKCYEKVSGQGGGHDEPDNCILADSRKAAFDVDRFSSISNTKTRCDEQLLPGADNLRGVAEFENTGSNDF